MTKTSASPSHLGYELLNEDEKHLLLSVNRLGSTSIDEVESDFREVHSLIAKGHLRLAAIQCPWGIELEIEPTKRGGEYLDRTPIEVSAKSEQNQPISHRKPQTSSEHTPGEPFEEDS